MLPLRLGLGLSTHLWRGPAGLVLALILLLSGPLLVLLAPASALRPELPGGGGLVGLAVLGGAALALAGLGRRAALLELVPLRARLQVQAVAVVAAGLEAAAATAAGAALLAGQRLPLGGAPIAAVHLAGIALPLLACAMQGPTRVTAFLALTWWLPALALDEAGWQGVLRAALATGAAGASALPGTSESLRTGTMLPAAFLAAAVVLGGALTARTLSRIR
jgi:hypothetical protein